MVQSDLDLLWGPLVTRGVVRDNRVGPVTLGRELLIQAYEEWGRTGSPTRTTELVEAAAKTFLSVIERPRREEYPIDGEDFGRCDAMMWFGISSGLLTRSDTRWYPSSAARPRIIQQSSGPETLAVASFGFQALSDLTKAARCCEEFAELIKADKGPNAARTYFQRAADLFDTVGDVRRAAAARIRQESTDHPSSSFFHRHLLGSNATTITGSQEFRTLRAITMARQK